jgi:hypothetical protein
MTYPDWSNAAGSEYADRLAYDMVGVFVGLFGSITDSDLAAIETRVYKGVRFKDGLPDRDNPTPDRVTQCLEQMGWPI